MPDPRPHPLERRIPPPIVALALAVAVRLIGPSERAPALPPVARLALSGGLALLAGGLGLPALLAFRCAGTTVDPRTSGRASVLVTTGVFRLTRNPMYVALAALLAAWAAQLSTPWAALAPLAFVAYVTRFQIVPEERVLAERFGEAYRRYAARTRRWL